MKKIINKLFEKLGYVPKSKLELYKRDFERYKHLYNCRVNMDNAIDNNTAYYYVLQREDSFLCIVHIRGNRRPIKSFPFNDDKEYALICANELCDMLNQKY